mmetsp:Transcript_34075/g.73803  ORF Transcript_34075/g.73803 Transcript_34075/m.73803 type:complete len:464 (-) Transcript_34075:575-1966(-)
MLGLLVPALLLEQRGEPGSVKELEVVHLWDLGKPWSLGSLAPANHLVPVVIVLVVLDLLPLPGSGPDPVGSHVRLEVHPLRNSVKLSLLVLVIVDRHASVQGELDRALRKLLELVVQILCLFLTLADDGLNILVGDRGTGGTEDLVRTVPHHIQEVLLLDRLVSTGILKPALLDHEGIQLELLVGLLDDLLLDGVLRAEAVDVDLLLLTDTMGPVHSLEIHLRVPVRVVQDHDIGRVKVDSETSGSRGQQEGELLRVWRVVSVDAFLPVLSRGVSVDPAVLVPPEEHVVLQDIEQTGHLREDQHAGSLLLEPRQKLIEENHLTGVLDEVHVRRERWPRLGSLEQVRVVAALPELHDDVEEPAPLSSSVDGVNVLLHQVLVPLELHLRHTDLEDGLLLGRQALLNLRLHPPQQERPQKLVQLHDGLVLLALAVDLEPLVELLGGREHVRQQKVQERPQLVQVVL